MVGWGRLAAPSKSKAPTRALLGLGLGRSGLPFERLHPAVEVGLHAAQRCVDDVVNVVAQVVHPAAEGIKALVDDIEALVDGVKTLVDGVETLVHLVEPAREANSVRRLRRLHVAQDRKDQFFGDGVGHNGFLCLVYCYRELLTQSQADSRSCPIRNTWRVRRSVVCLPMEGDTGVDVNYTPP